MAESKQLQKENVVLCGANSYEQKYYFNPDFAKLPESIRQELQIMCVLFTEDVGGILTMEFTPEGELEFKVQVDENDYLFDEIGSGLKIKQYQMEKWEFLEGLELFYQVFFLGADPSAFLDEAEEDGAASDERGAAEDGKQQSDETGAAEDEKTMTDKTDSVVKDEKKAGGQRAAEKEKMPGDSTP